MSRVIITVPDEFLATIDNAAAQQHRTRSELFREAMRQYLQNTPTPAGPSAQEAAGIIEELRALAVRRARAVEDSTETIRAFRGYPPDEEAASSEPAAR